jgi:hypothetical protein
MGQSGGLSCTIATPPGGASETFHAACDSDPVGAEYEAVGEVRGRAGEPWRFVAQTDLARGHELDHLLFGNLDTPTLERDGFTGFPQLETIWGLPEDFHRSVQLRCALERLQARAKAEDLDRYILEDEEEELKWEILSPLYEGFDISSPRSFCWVTLGALERYPWDTTFQQDEGRRGVKTVSVGDEVRPRFNGAIERLAAARSGEDARLVICRY